MPMRKRFRSAVLWGMSCLCALAPLSAASTVGAEPLPTYVTIVEDLPLYDTPNPHATTAGTVGPQTMQVLETKHNSAREWLSVNTWLGPKWISPSFDYQGALKRTEPFELQLYEDTVLYDFPSKSTATKYRIGPQEVHADAVAYVYDQGEQMNWQFQAVRIDTWLGKKWIIPDRYLPYVEKTNETVTLNTYTLLFGGVTGATDVGPPGVFSHTLSYLPIDGMIAPQDVQAFEKYWSRNESTAWYHVRTASGHSAWVNPRLQMPAEIVPENKAYNLTRTTSIHTYPFDYAPTLGAAAPQQIDSFERAGSWIHVHTWAGDGWLRVQDEQKLDMTDAEHRVQVGVTPNPFPDHDFIGPVHTSLNLSVAVAEPPYARSDIELHFEIYNDKGDVQEILKMVYNAGIGEARNLFVYISGNFNFRNAKVRLKSATFKPAEDRSQDVYASISRLD